MIDQLRQLSLRLSLTADLDATGAPVSFFRFPPAVLSSEQVRQLEFQGNSSRDWSRVRIAPGGNRAAIRHCEFEGDCLIGLMGTEGVGRLDRVRMRDSIVGDQAELLDVGELTGAVVSPGARIARVGRIASTREHCFGLEREIVFSPGSGGRQLPVFPEVPPAALAELARHMADQELLHEYRGVCAAYRKRNASDRTIIGRGARIEDTARIEDSYIGPQARIIGAAAIESCVLLSLGTAPTEVGAGVVLRRVTAQENCRFVDGAQCENSHFGEASWAKDGARVSSSIVAENSGVGGGECRTSFVGPFVAFHHQSLLIATFWPGGRGNVSYGANVGSNHSGRAPDQEHWAGEGVFYGLGANIKFPANYQDAPYSIIASGVTTLPQLVRFPFSLINSPSFVHPSLPPAFNEIFPGWTIENNMYGLLRNEAKFAERNRARRETVETRAFRPAMAPMLLRGLKGLRRAQGTETLSEAATGPFYLERQVPGIGKNYMRAMNLEAGVGAYEFGLRFILARTMADAIERGEAPLDAARRDIPSFSAQDLGEDSLVSEQGVRDFLLRTFGRAMDLAVACRNKDDHRGVAIIPDYPAVHGSAISDDFLQALHEQLVAKWS